MKIACCGMTVLGEHNRLAWVKDNNERSGHKEGNWENCSKQKNSKGCRTNNIK